MLSTMMAKALVYCAFRAAYCAKMLASLFRFLPDMSLHSQKPYTVPCQRKSTFSYKYAGNFGISVQMESDIAKKSYIRSCLNYSDGGARQIPITL